MKHGLSTYFRLLKSMTHQTRAWSFDRPYMDDRPLSMSPVKKRHGAQKFIKDHQILNAVRQGNVCLLKTALNGRRLPFKKRVRYAVWEAVEKGYCEVISLLSQAGFHFNFRSQKTGDTPLHLAINLQNHHMVRALCQTGVRINVPTRWGFFPLQLALQNADIQTASVLIDQGADLYYLNKTGTSAFVDAARLGSIFLMEQMVQKINHPTPLVKSQGIWIRFYHPFLRIKAWRDQKRMSRALIEALHAAIEEHQNKMVEFMIGHLHVSSQSCNKYGRTAYLTAARAGNLKMMAWLKNQGADTMSRDADGLSADDLIKAAKGSDRGCHPAPHQSPVQGHEWNPAAKMTFYAQANLFQTPYQKGFQTILPDLWGRPVGRRVDTHTAWAVKGRLSNEATRGRQE